MYWISSDVLVLGIETRNNEDFIDVFCFEEDIYGLNPSHRIEVEFEVIARFGFSGVDNEGCGIGSIGGCLEFRGVLDVHTQG